MTRMEKRKWWAKNNVYYIVPMFPIAICVSEIIGT
jgi:hypothetical protein